MSDCKITLVVVPEYFRLAGLFAFYFVFASTYTITLIWNPTFLTDNAVGNMMGYNQACTWFDSMPARPYGLWFCNLACFMWFVYAVLSWVRMHQAFKDIAGMPLSYWIYTIFIVIECFCYSMFCMVFTHLTTHNFKFADHVLGFKFLIIALCISDVRTIAYNI